MDYLTDLAKKTEANALVVDTHLYDLANQDDEGFWAATGRRIDLESFGPSNVAVYARWLGPTASAR